MSDSPNLARKPGKLILPSLVFASFATSPPAILTGLLLVDIGLTFGCPVGIAGQIPTAHSIVAVISAMLMGALSVKFRHRSLLLIGLLFMSISALGSSIAPNFNMMLIIYSLGGFGTTMILPITRTLAADHFPLDKRTSAIGWLDAGRSLSYVIGAPAIGFIAGLGGWRLSFLGFVLPICLLGLLLAYKGLPSTPCNHHSTMGKSNYLEGFKAVLSNRSAFACLVSLAFLAAAYQALGLYSSSFFRQRFLVSTTSASFIILAAALCFTSGSLLSGRFVKKFGRKPSTVLTLFISCIFIISYTNLLGLWLSLVATYLGWLFAGIAFTASTSLTLEQVPRFRGAMMSIHAAALSIGSALGAGIGGLTLLLYDYRFVGISLGGMGFVGAMVLYLLAIDPTRT